MKGLLITDTPLLRAIFTSRSGWKDDGKEMSDHKKKLPACQQYPDSIQDNDAPEMKDVDFFPGYQ